MIAPYHFKRVLRSAAAVRTLETRRNTLSISQPDQRLTRSVPNPEVSSFGENGPARERIAPSGAAAVQQVRREKPAVIGLSGVVVGMERRFAQVQMAVRKGFEPLIRLQRFH